MNKWMNWRMGGCMDGWTERPLCWGAPSLSYFLSEQPLIWGTSTLPPSSSVASATQFFSSRRCCAAFSNLQLHRQQRGLFFGRSDPLTVFNDFYVKPSSRCSPAHFLPTSSSKSAPRLSVSKILNSKSCSRNSPLLFLSITFPDGVLHPRKQRPYCGNPRSHFTRKIRGFRARECFHPWIHTSLNCYTSQRLDNGWLTWWCGWHDGENANRNNRTQLGSLLTKLPLTIGSKWTYTTREKMEKLKSWLVCRYPMAKKNCWLYTVNINQDLPTDHQIYNIIT